MFKRWLNCSIIYLTTPQRLLLCILISQTNTFIKFDYFIIMILLFESASLIMHLKSSSCIEIFSFNYKFIASSSWLSEKYITYAHFGWVLQLTQKNRKIIQAKQALVNEQNILKDIGPDTPNPIGMSSTGYMTPLP